MIHIFYHDDMDGVASLYAYVQGRSLPHDEFTAHAINYKYDSAILGCVNFGDEVVFVDFSPENKDIGHLINIVGDSIEVWDHHSGTEVRMRELAENNPFELHFDSKAKGACNLIADYYGVKSDAIKLIGYRDVWDFSGSGTRELHAWCITVAPSSDHKTWLKTFEGLDTYPLTLETAIKAGAKLVAQMDAVVAKQVTYATELCMFGHTVLAANTHEHISETGSALAKAGCGVGLVYSIVDNTVRMSFRSLVGAKVSALTFATKFGGGGHNESAGATITLEAFTRFLSAWQETHLTATFSLFGFEFDLTWHKSFPPMKKTNGSRAYDLCSRIDLTLKPGEMVVIPTGVSWNVTKCDEERCIEIQITSRSGMARDHRVWIAKGVGTIDSDYRGEIGVDLINCGDKDYVIKAGDSIAQAIFRTDINVNFPELVIEKERGDGGYGSTGK